MSAIGNTPVTNYMPNEVEFQRGLRARNLRGGIWARFYYLSLIIAIVALVALIFNIVNEAFGYVGSVYAIEPEDVVPGRDFDSLNEPELVAVLNQYQARRIPVYIRDTMSVVPNTVFTQTPLGEALRGRIVPEEFLNLTIREAPTEVQLQILSDNLSVEEIRSIVESDVIQERVVKTWSLFDSLFNFGRIQEEFNQGNVGTNLYFKSWVSLDFLNSPGSSSPTVAGVRTALIGTLWVVSIAVLFSFPVGVGAAIYLEEYATRSRFNQLIETNIRNLAGVPSIIYGLLGLAILVRNLEFITQGRTILSAGLTLGLLILPVIIINSQEALRAVPSSIREASYGVGATKWQTIWNQVLPAAMPGILTGTILGLSRAVGETAPLVVIGASTFITIDPNGPFDKFTALPIQIYQWTARPQSEFRSIAAAAIVVLMVVLLLLNTSAIILRQRFRRSLQG